ncbi:MAG: signal peptide peptidase SppA [Pseudomonadota bacterium]
MSLDVDNLIVRRKMRRRVSFWRAICIVLGVVTLVALAYGSNGSGFSLGKRADHVARIRVEGMITGDTKTLDMLRDIEKAKQVKALLVHIDSPGGTTAGSEAIYERLRIIAKDRPVVAVMNTVAASGGYITAIAADHIVARGNTITGSVGVIFQWAQVEKLLNSIGIAMQERKSGSQKAEPNIFSDPTAETLAVTDAMIRDSFVWFTDLVKERRKLSGPQMTLISDGRVFTGRQALTAKLVDKLGGEDEAIEWLSAEHKISKDMKVIDWEPAPAPGTGSLGLFGLGKVARWLGFSAAVDALEARTVKLDGLLVLWHPNLR